MKKIEELLEDSVRNAPLALLALRDKEQIKIVNSFLPYSTGFEIECSSKYFEYSNTANAFFNEIPDIMAVLGSSGEQRYRIPKGIKGIVCLYNICELLPEHLELNPLSGIHYHVDMTECYNEAYSHINSLNRNDNWILDELDAWEYKGIYNARSIGGWIRLNGLQTAEFRCGEMSFDYSYIIDKIIHANDIIRRVKQEIGIEFKPDDKVPDFSNTIEYLLKTQKSADIRGFDEKLEKLRKELKEIEEEEEKLKQEALVDSTSMDEMKAIINKRIIYGK